MEEHLQEQKDQPLMSLAQIEVKLKSRRLYFVAKETGLSYPTLKKMADGENANYTLATLRAISDYLRDEECE
jgi:DNA-binding Xre family transcriptional regulator